MRLAPPAILVGLAAQANAALLSVSDGVTITVSACEPIIVSTAGTNITATIATSGSWLPPNATGKPYAKLLPAGGPSSHRSGPKLTLDSQADLTSSELVASPTETGPETTIPTAGAMPRPFESSMVGLLGFFIVSLIML
jgi:hypothetical protein